jgi:hypothetical protein
VAAFSEKNFNYELFSPLWPDTYYICIFSWLIDSIDLLLFFI